MKNPDTVNISEELDNGFEEQLETVYLEKDYAEEEKKTTDSINGEYGFKGIRVVRISLKKS